MSEVEAIERPPGGHAAPVATGPLPPGHPPLPPRRVGILLINLGTPDATDYWSMRRYLAEFLSDKRVIDYPTWLWQPLLQLVILTKRPFSSGKAYRSIWNSERDESPLRTVTRSQAEKLAALPSGTPGSPSTGPCATATPRSASVSTACGRRLRPHCAHGPLPAHAAPTTATAYDKAFEADDHAPPAGHPHHGPLSRRSPLHRASGQEHRAASGRARLGARAAHHVLSRRAEALPHQRRPLSLYVPQDDAPRARAPRLGRGTGHDLLPVQVRHRGMAAALFRPDPGAAAEGGREAHRGDLAGLRHRLRRDLEEIDQEGRHDFLPPAAKSSRIFPA